jgi:hypothetical protein
MATLTISDAIFERLAQQAQTLNASPDAVAESVLETYLAAASTPSLESAPPIHTLGDLLAFGYGLWANRNEMEDTPDYAARLRTEAWQRHL